MLKQIKYSEMLTFWVIKVWNNYLLLHGLFLSGVGEHSALELDEEEDNGGFVNPVGGGGWTDELMAVCRVLFDGSFASA